MNTYENSDSEILDLGNVLEFAHFRNACQTSRFYSCAIDCFLELSYRLILPEILKKVEISEMSGFFNSMYITGLTEIEIGANGNLRNHALELLDEVR